MEAVVPWLIGGFFFFVLANFVKELPITTLDGFHGSNERWCKMHNLKYKVEQGYNSRDGSNFFYWYGVDEQGNWFVPREERLWGWKGIETFNPENIKWKIGYTTKKFY